MRRIVEGIVVVVVVVVVIAAVENECGRYQGRAQHHGLKWCCYCHRLGTRRHVASLRVYLLAEWYRRL